MLEGLGFGRLARAADFGVQPYSRLRMVLKGTGLEAHHIIEKRFAALLGEKASGMASVAVTSSEHAAFTNAWRAAISYGRGTASASKESVLKAARQIYREYPAILKALGK
jgi:hypothetical protein